MVLRPSNCRWALHLSESYLHRWRHAVSEEVEIGSFGSTFESLFWQWISQNRSSVAGSNSPGQGVYLFSRTLVKLERGVNSCRVKLWPFFLGLCIQERQWLSGHSYWCFYGISPPNSINRRFNCIVQGINLDPPLDVESRADI